MAAQVELAPAMQRLRTRGRPGPLLLGCALIAAVALFDPWGFAPFGPLKHTAIVVGLLLAAAATDRAEIDRRVAILWALLLGWFAFAAVFGADPLHAWIGTPERRMGWLSWALLAIAWLGGSAAGEPSDLRRLLRATTVAAGALGLYALAEVFGIAPVDVTFAGGRAGGQFGQPAYLGAAAVLLTPVAVGLAADRAEATAWRAVAAVAAVLGSVAVLAAQARAAWVGLAIACLPLAGAAWRAARRRPTVAGAVGVALVLLLFATPIGGRVASIADPDGTAAARVDEWRTALAAVSDAPLLGYGPEGYRTVFPRFVDADYARAHGREVIPDRAHSGVLDAAVMGGIPAALFYAALMCAIALATLQACRRRDPLRTGLAVGVLAYAIQQQLLFPVLETDVLFWALAGALLAGPGSAPRVVLRRPPLAAPVLTVAAVAALVLGGLEVAADRLLADAAAAGPTGQRAALASADRAIRLRPDSIRARYVAARIAARGPALTAVDAALDRIEGALRLSPGDPAARAEQARLLVERARRSALPQNLDRALDAVRGLVTDDPAHPRHRLLLADALELAGDPEAAEAQRQAAEGLALEAAPDRGRTP